LSTLNAGSTSPGADSYALYNGTSMATPHVSGVVALMLSVKPTLTPDQVTSILQSTARAFPATCSQCGSAS
jgi:serine protease